MNHELPPQQPDKSPDTRSWLRKMTDPPLQWTTERIHGMFPEITADQVTIAGGLGVAAGSLMQMYQLREIPYGEKQSMTPLIVLSAGLIADAVDGKMAKLNGTYGKGNGALYDAVTDRTNNAFLAMTRMQQAHAKGSPAGEILALTSGMTGLLPSWYRAQTEAKAIPVNEGGNAWWEFFGTHAGRSILQAAAISIPAILSQPQVRNFVDRRFPVSSETLMKVPYQEICDAVTTAISAKVSYDRFKQSQLSPEYGPFDEAQQLKQDAAQRKLGPYMTLMGINLAAMLGTYYGLHQDEIHNYLSNVYSDFSD
ncbi:CDP-alcohol phosphatidyltransferase family protein [Candidatus Roizmanbacteria bacterium]|nr:MAG: CDP-alcohol phosphatidyltransferase family protein [Candidatus Roizmanbacteria bacterium]